MKKRIMAGAATFAVVLVASLTVQAQLVQQYLFHVDIPFPFAAGGTHLPAGHYHVYHPGDPYVVILQKDDNRARAMVYIHPSATDVKTASTKLVFNKYGERYFLSQVWTEGDSEVHQAFKCKAEQVLAAESGKPRSVAVVLARK